MEIRNLTQVDGTNKAFIFHLQYGENVPLPWTKKNVYRNLYLLLQYLLSM